MLRDIFTNRWIIGSFVLLLILTAGCIFWYRYTLAPYEQMAAEAQQVAHEWHLTQQVDTQDENHVPVEREILTTPAEKPKPESTVAVKNKTDAPRQQHAQTPQENMTAVAVPVSPFGLGPYPEIPAHWPQDIQHFPAPNKEVELITRVCIALNSEGYNAIGGTIENGRVFANIENVVYISWTEDERAGRYISSVGGHPEAAMRFEKLLESFEASTDRNFTLADVPSDIKVVDYDDGGIEPYSFLGL